MLNAEAQRAIERMSEQAQSLADRMQELSGDGTDDQELVRATGAAGGQLTDIEFMPLSRRLHTHELRDAVLQAVQRASTAAQQALATTLADFADSADSLGGDVVGRARRQVEDYRQLVDEQRAKLEGMREGSGAR